jgi:hypothetical protein
VYVSSTSTTSSLGGKVQWGLDGGHAKMDSGKSVAPFGLRGGNDGRSAERLRFGFSFGDGLAERGGGDYGVCAQSAFFGLHRRVGDGGGRGTRPCPIL